MGLEGLYSSREISIEMDASLADAARLMRSEDVSSVGIREGGEIVGLITERDLVIAAAQGVLPEEAAIREYATEALFTADVSDDPIEVARRMLRLGVRHIPVVDGGELVGIVSMRDLLAGILGETGR